MRTSIKVWDLPTRVGHWLLVATFITAFTSAESERWRLVHIVSGSLMGAVIVFRMLWGIVGSRYARFAEFVKAPRAVVIYMRSILIGTKAHYVGHNPAGGWSVLALLAFCVLIVSSGLLAYFERGPRWSGSFHEWISNGAVALVAIHVVGVIAGSLMDRENLIRAMITGRKSGSTSDAIASNRVHALLLLVSLCAVAVWLVAY